MPFYLEERDPASELAAARSVLIVPCRFCPAASVAVREKKPYVELLRSGLRTAAYEEHVRGLKRRLEHQGLAVEVFGGRSPEFVVCMWSAKRRKELAAKATRHDAVVVLGCDAALETVRSAVGASGCRIVRGMVVEGVMNVAPTVRFPFNVSLELVSVTRVLEYEPPRSPAA